MSDTTHALLQASLAAAVPLWCAEIRARGAANWERVVPARSHELARIIAEHGDIIQFRSKKRGETAAAFNALAEALALMSFAPGGVRFLGDRWESHFGDCPRDQYGNRVPSGHMDD